MKFSTKTRYGIRAVLEIAMNGDVDVIYQKEIAKNQNISYKYLDQIINALKVAGLVTKAAGRKSGYVLTRDPADISVYDIHTAFEPGICVVDCMEEGFLCDREKTCSLRDFWKTLNNQVTGYFKSTTIKQLMEQQTNLKELEQATSNN